MSHDPKCYELAVHFLEDYRDPVLVTDAQRLAEHIQQCIEDYFIDEGMEPK